MILTEDLFFEQKLPSIKPFIDNFRIQDLDKRFSEVSDREVRSVYFYTTEHPEFSYLAINPYLAKGSFESSSVQFLVQSIDSCLMKLPSYVGTVIRLENHGGWMHSKITSLLSSSATKLGEVTSNYIEQVSNEFFMSTTLRSMDELSIKPMVFVILSKLGGRYIVAFSAFQDEKEVLFKRNSKFIIVSIDDSIENKIIVTLAEVST